MILVDLKKRKRRGVNIIGKNDPNRNITLSLHNAN